MISWLNLDPSSSLTHSYGESSRVINQWSINRESKYLEFPHEGIDTNDSEDEPEDDADHQHVEDARNGLDEGVHNDLEVQS